MTMKSVIEILKTPAVYAALSGLMSAIGWEIQDSRFIDHMLGLVGALAGFAGIILATQERKNNAAE